MTGTPEPSWILLMRHGRRADTGTAGPLHPAGVAAAREVGEALAQQIDEQRRGKSGGITRLVVRHAGTAVTVATARRVAVAVRVHLRPAPIHVDVDEEGPLRPFRNDPPVDSDAVGAASDQVAHEWVEEAAKALVGHEKPQKPTGGDRSDSVPTGEAVLYVGHEPGTSALAAYLTRDRWFRPLDVPALTSAEILAIGRVRRRWQPRWTLTPHDENSESAVADKVKAKLDVAKVFGPFLAALLVFTAQTLFKVPTDGGFPWPYIRGLSIGALGAASLLYFATLFFYDGLLMPKRYWSRPRPGPVARLLGRSSGTGRMLRRPPGPASWVLYQNMQRVWRRTFVPATVATGVGLAAFVGAATEPSRATTPVDRFAFETAITAGVIVLLAVVWVMASRPAFGAND